MAELTLGRVVRTVRQLRVLAVGQNAGTILDRAVRAWKGSDFAFLHPVRGHTQPAQYELARRIADEYPDYFEDDLVALLSSPNPVVVAHALTTLRWMKSPTRRFWS